jgi:hypothetical protein
LDCIGNFDWGTVSPGETKRGTFIVKNVGPEYSLLDWEIESYPNWGKWSFTADEGNDLVDEKVISVAVTVPEDMDEEFIGKIKVVNTNDRTDFDNVEVSVKTTNRNVIKNGLLLSYLLDLFPFLKTFFDLY